MAGNRLFQTLVGDVNRFKYEHRLFNAYCFFSSIFMLLASALNVLFDFGPYMILINFLGFVVLFVSYAISRLMNIHNNILMAFMVIFSYACLLGQWFHSGGSNGGLAYTLYVALVFAAIILPRKLKVPFVIVLFLNMVIFLVIEFYYPGLVVAYESNSSRLVDLIGNMFISCAAITALMISYSRNYDETYHNLETEQQKSERLLLNTLPKKVIVQLRESGNTSPERFENVTVLFSDIVNFTGLSSTLNPTILIGELNDIYTAFDTIVENNQCERIKTSGDAYLCVCGLPEKNVNHAKNIVNSALQMIDYMNERNTHSIIKWQIRIGINSGCVVGGIVGVKKYIYDIFGDAVNTASRMERLSDPMSVNISDATFELVKGDFCFVDRGCFEVKGKGKMNMYFVESTPMLGQT